MTLTLYGGARSRASLVRWYLEEKHLPYNWVQIDLAAGEQHQPAFRAINPFGKVPALVDSSFPLPDGRPLGLFESGAILLHLAEKFGAFVPRDAAGRAECLSWLFWQMGSAPYLGGGFGHFYAYAPTKIEYAIDQIGRAHV